MKYDRSRTPYMISALIISIGIIIAIVVACIVPHHSHDSVPAPSLHQSAPLSVAPLPKAVLVSTDSPRDPVSLQVGDSRSRVVGISAKASGVLDPPEDVSLIGWDVHSSQPGQPGVTLMTGHSDNWDKIGSAHIWERLHTGDTIIVYGRKKTRWLYRVSQVHHVKKYDKFPSHLVNDRTGKNRLVLVTCTGRVVGSALGHEDNIFIVAKLVGSRKMSQ